MNIHTVLYSDSGYMWSLACFCVLCDSMLFYLPVWSMYVYMEFVY